MSTWRRIKTATRYKLNFALEILLGFAWGLGLLVFTAIVDPVTLRGAIGTANYVSFLLIGIAFQSYYSAAIWGSPWEIQNELTTGQAEFTFASPVSRYSYMLSYSISQAIVNTVFQLLPMFAMSMLFIGSFPSLSAIGLTLVSIVLTFLVMCQVGVMMSCLLLIFKNISSLMSFVNFLMQVATGMFAPLQLMPNELKMIAFVIPLTHGMDLSRHFIMGTNTIWSVGLELGALAIFLVAFTAISIFLVSYVEKKAKGEGLSLA